MRRLLVIGLIGLAASCGGCSERAPEVASEAPASRPVTAGTPDAGVMAKWARSCALCHVNGEGGAPRSGVRAEWSPRLAAGEERLLIHTVEGYNNMPPLGYCMDCERDDFLELIRFMAAGS